MKHLPDTVLRARSRWIQRTVCRPSGTPIYLAVGLSFLHQLQETTTFTSSAFDTALHVNGELWAPDSRGTV